MRRYSESFIIYLIFGAIIVVFALSFGQPGSCRGGGGANMRYAVLVDGEPIDAVKYSRQLKSVLDWQRQRMKAAGMEASDDMLERMGLRQQVIDELIDQKILAQQARRMGLQVTDEELVDHIYERYPHLKDFTAREEANWIGNVFGVTKQRFEADTRDEILAARFAKVIMQNVSVSDGELLADFEREHDRAMVAYVKFDARKVQVPEPTTADIQKLLTEEKEAVEASYNSDVFKYRTPHRVAARHILKKLAADASEAEVAKVRGELVVLASQIESGADFAALAKEMSEDEATKDEGGSLGMFRKGEQPKPIADAAFELKKDEVTSEPVRTDVGLHLVQVTEIKPPERQPLEEVQEDVAKALFNERFGKVEAEKKAQGLLAELQKGGAFEELTISEAEAKEGKTDQPTRFETAWILKSQEAIPRIGTSEELKNTIFALTKEAPLATQVFEVNEAFYVVQLKDREIPDREVFEKDKDNLRSYAISAKQSRVFRSWMSHVKERTTIEYNDFLFPTEAPNDAPAGEEAEG